MGSGAPPTESRPVKGLDQVPELFPDQLVQQNTIKAMVHRDLYGSLVIAWDPSGSPRGVRRYVVGAVLHRKRVERLRGQWRPGASAGWAVELHLPRADL